MKSEFRSTSVTKTNIFTSWIRQKISDAIAFSQLIFKHYYDQKHKFVHFSKKNWTLLRLHQNYSIPFTKKLEKKLFQQFVESFKIFQRVENLVYKLEIPTHWRIHSVFIIAQLKLVFDPKSDFYGRQRTQPSSVHVEENIDTIKSYVVEKIIRIRITIRSKKYFIKWKGYGSEKNAWKNLFEMNNALNLIRKYEKRHPNDVFSDQSSSPKNQFIRKRGRLRKWKRWWKHHPSFCWRQIVTKTKFYFSLIGIFLSRILTRSLFSI